MKAFVYLPIIVLLACQYESTSGSAIPETTAGAASAAVVGTPTPIPSEDAQPEPKTTADDAVVITPIPFVDAQPESKASPSSAPVTLLRLRTRTIAPLRQGTTAGRPVSDVVESRDRDPSTDDASEPPQALGEAWESFMNHPILMIISLSLGAMVACCIFAVIMILPCQIILWVLNWCYESKAVRPSATHPTKGATNTADEDSDASSISTTESMEEGIDYSGRIHIDMNIVHLHNC